MQIVKGGLDLRNFLKSRLIQPLLNQLKQGITPEKLAMSTAIGATVGIFPIPGVTTSLCFIFGVFFKLNHPTLQVVNYALTPVHFLMIPVFIRIGENIFHHAHVPFNPNELLASFKEAPLQLLSQFGASISLGIFAWFLIVPPIGFLIYRLALIIFRKRKSNYL